MAERRGYWFLLTGVLLGIALGLLFAWVVSPVKYVDTEPHSLRADFKDQYRALIAAAYAASGDLGRANGRLVLLQDENPAAALSAQAMRPDTSANEARYLGRLAMALVNPANIAPNAAQTAAVIATQAAQQTGTARPPETLTPSPTTAAPTAAATPARTARASASPTRTAAPTQTVVLPTPIPTATPGAPFALQEQKQVCDANVSQPLLQVQVNDAAGQPVPGVEIVVSWQGEQNDHFFTGLKPEISPGYADFVMTPGVIYSLRLADGGQPVTNLYAPGCPGGRTGGLLLTFVQK